MLASTVQFSRNGQHHSRHPASAEGGSWPVLKTRAKARSLRTQQRAHPGQAIKAPVPPPSRKGSVLAAPSRAGRVNSQCSTRKHGRPASRSLT